MNMKRLILITLILVGVAACHDDGVGMDMESGPDASIANEVHLEDLTVTWSRFDSARTETDVIEQYLRSEEVKVDSNRVITTSIDVEWEDGSTSNLCAGMSTLSEGTYELVLQRVIQSGIREYDASREDECGTMNLMPEGAEVSYREAGDEVAAHNWACTYDNGMHELEMQIASLAMSHFPDCIWQEVEGAYPEDAMFRDSDSDCIEDSVEMRTRTDPNNPDTDGDGLPDGWDESTGLGEDLNCNGRVDIDGDGLQLETDPRLPDSDGDGVSDWDEMTFCCSWIPVDEEE